MGKVSTLTHFPLVPGCEDYSFLDRAAKDFEHGLDSILAHTIDKPKVDTSFDKAIAMPSSVSSRFLGLARTDSDNSRLQLTSSIIS